MHAALPRIISGAQWVAAQAELLAKKEERIRLRAPDWARANHQQSAGKAA